MRLRKEMNLFRILMFVYAVDSGLVRTYFESFNQYSVWINQYYLLQLFHLFTHLDHF